MYVIMLVFMVMNMFMLAMFRFTRMIHKNLRLKLVEIGRIKATITLIIKQYLCCQLINNLRVFPAKNHKHAIFHCKARSYSDQNCINSLSYIFSTCSLSEEKLNYNPVSLILLNIARL